MNRIIVAGCGGHARSVIDAILSAGIYEIAGFVDREINEEYVYRGYKIIGTDADLPMIYASGIHNACIGIGYMGEGTVRRKLFDSLKQAGFDLPPIADRTAAVAGDALLGEGAFVGKKSVVNAASVIGNAAIINSGAIVEHDCKVGDFAHIAVGAVLCGNVEIGDDALVGANATVIQGLRIGSAAVVGAGSVVTKNIGAGIKAAGVPARTLK